MIFDFVVQSVSVLGSCDCLICGTITCLYKVAVIFDFVVQSRVCTR